MQKLLAKSVSNIYFSPYFNFSWDYFSSLPVIILFVLVLMSLGKVYLSNKKSRLKKLEDQKYCSNTINEGIQDYTHRKNKTKNIEKKILDFHVIEAKKYFDVCEYSFEQLLDKLYNRRQITLQDKILLHKDVMNLEIRTLLEDLKEITGIPMNALEMLFMRFCSKDKKYINVKSSNINSSKSQSVRF